MTPEAGPPLRKLAAFKLIDNSVRQRRGGLGEGMGEGDQPHEAIPAAPGAGGVSENAAAHGPAL